MDSAVNTGLVFNGNTGNNITKKLGDTLSIKGNLANADAATATNLRVDEENGELKIKLARNLTDLVEVQQVQVLQPMVLMLVIRKLPMLRMVMLVQQVKMRSMAVN